LVVDQVELIVSDSGEGVGWDLDEVESVAYALVEGAVLL